MDFQNFFLLCCGFAGGFLFTYIFTLIRFIFIDYLEWPYTIMLVSLMVLTVGSSLSDGRLSWIYNNRDRLQQATRVASAMMPKPNLSSSPFSIADSNKSASLIYNRMGTDYILNVPYNPSFRRISNRISVLLIKSDKKSVDVTHQPCIPYFCTAEELGGIGYEVFDKGTGEIIKKYQKDEIPNLNDIRKAL